MLFRSKEKKKKKTQPKKREDKCKGEITHNTNCKHINLITRAGIECTEPLWKSTDIDIQLSSW